MMNMNRFIQFLLVPGFAALALAACGSDSSTQMAAGPVAGQQPQSKLVFNVERLERASAFQSPGGPSHIEGELSIPLDQKVLEWAENRMDARGGIGIGRFVVVDASLVETAVEDPAATPLSPRAPQTIRFDASIVVSFEILDGSGARKAFAEARTAASRTLYPYASDAARKQALNGLVDAVMRKFDVEVEKVLRAHVASYFM